MSEDILTQQTLSEYGVVSRDKTYSEKIKELCWTAFWVNIGLALFKLFVGGFSETIGMMGFSQLLLIDGLNSAANAVVITMILFGVSMSRPLTINEKYPYGKGKAQFVCTLLVGTLLAISSTTILALAFKTLLIPITLEPLGIGICTALISISVNGLLIRYIKHSGFKNNNEFKTIIRLQSINIIASTILCNSLLLTGLLGWFFMERFGSLTISLIVVWLSVRIIKQSLDGIMDRSCGQETETSIRNIIQEVDDVQDIQCVRTRNVGQNLCIDIRLGLSGDISIRQADSIDQEVRKRISNKLSKVHHVITLDCFPT